MLLKCHVTVVETLIVTTGPCITRVAYSKSGQPKPQLGGVQSPTYAQGWGGGEGGGVGGEGGGRRGVAALHHLYHNYGLKVPKP